MAVSRGGRVFKDEAAVAVETSHGREFGPAKERDKKRLFRSLFIGKQGRAERAPGAVAEAGDHFGIGFHFAGHLRGNRGMGSGRGPDLPPPKQSKPPGPDAL